MNLRSSEQNLGSNPEAYWWFLDRTPPLTDWAFRSSSTDLFTLQWKDDAALKTATVHVRRNQVEGVLYVHADCDGVAITVPTPAVQPLDKATDFGAFVKFLQHDFEWIPA